MQDFSPSALVSGQGSLTISTCYCCARNPFDIVLSPLLQPFPNCLLWCYFATVLTVLVLRTNCSLPLKYINITFKNTMTNTSLLSVFGNYIQPPTAALIIITSIVSVVSIHCRAFSYFLLVILFLVIFFFNYSTYVLSE